MIFSQKKQIFFDLLKEEEARIKSGINLIASENYCSQDVNSMLSSVFGAKYAEGLVGNRFYSGCKIVDAVELQTINLALELFGAEHANVQPHSGSQANQAVFLSLLNPSDKVLAMDFAAGGHLTHGHKLNFSGKNYNFEFYGVDALNEQINYDELEKKASTFLPRMIIAGASAYPRLIDFERIQKIAKKVNAIFFVDMAHLAGLVAAKQIPSPVELADVVTFTTHKTLRGPRGGMILCKKTFADKINRAVMPGVQGGPFLNNIAAKGIAFAEAATKEYVLYQKQVIKNAKLMAELLMQAGFRIVSEGTDTHLLLLDTRSCSKLTEENRNGKFVEQLLEQNNIFVNRNQIPFDTQGPFITSGIRLGTPAITTLGAKEEEIKDITQKIIKILSGSA